MPLAPLTNWLGVAESDLDMSEAFIIRSAKLLKRFFGTRTRKL
jgi:hypothetical protein